MKRIIKKRNKDWTLTNERLEEGILIYDANGNISEDIGIHCHNSGKAYGWKIKSTFIDEYCFNDGKLYFEWLKEEGSIEKMANFGIIVRQFRGDRQV